MEFDAASPIYLQIGDFIKEEIVSGRLTPGDRLKSVREYSLLFEVSNLTIHRALRQLELEGVIVTRKGVGSFVSSRVDSEAQLDMIQSHVKDFISKMRKFGLNGSAILAFVRDGLDSENADGAGKGDDHI